MLLKQSRGVKMVENTMVKYHCSPQVENQRNWLQVAVREQHPLVKWMQRVN